jgi:ABC-2 type transport system ATP-binding protein
MALAAREIKYSYGTNLVLDGVSFTVPYGKVVGLLGANGAGKTTLIRLLSTLLAMQGGDACVAGHDCRKDPLMVKKKLAVVPQGSTLNLELDVKQNMLTYLLLHGLSMHQAEKRIVNVSESFGLTSILNRHCMTLSGGYRRRVQIARAFATDAECLLLDEASAGLDPSARRELWNAIRSSSDNRAVLLTTHILDEASICDSLLFLRNGRIIAEGTPAELKAKHRLSKLTFSLSAGVEITPLLRHCLVECGVSSVEVEEQVPTLTLTGDFTGGLGDVIHVLSTHAVPFVQMSLAQPTLEDVFLGLQEDGVA